MNKNIKPLVSRNDFSDLVKSLGVGKKDVDMDELTEQYVWKTLYDSPVSSSIKMLARTLPANIYPIVSSISEDFAKIEISLIMDKKSKDGDIETVPVDDVYNLAYECLINVNSRQTTFNLFEATGYSYALLGMNIWHTPKAPRGSFREIYWLNPLSITNEKYDKWGFLISFDYLTSEGKTEHYANDYEAGNIEFVYDITFNLGDTRKGFAPVTPIQTIAETYKAAIDYNNKYFVNDATPTLLIKFKQKLTDTMKKIFKLDWLQQFRGKDRSHKFAITDSDMDVEQLGFSNKEMEFSKLIDLASREIMTNWRVNKVIVGQTESINRATLEGADANHARRVIDPMDRRFISMLNEKWLPLFIDKMTIRKNNIRFVYKSPITQDRELNASIANTGTAGKPYMTLNEARELNGLPKLDGDAYDHVPTYDETLNPYSSQNTPTDESQNDLKQEIQRLKDMNEHITIENTKILATKEGKDAKTEIDEQLLRDIAITHLERALKYEPLFKDAVSGYFKGLYERFDLEDAINNSPKSYLDKFEKQVNWNDEAKKLIDSVKNVAVAVAAEAWADADKLVPGTLPFDLDSFDLTKFIEENLQFFTQTVVNNTRKQLARIIEESLVSGLSIDDIAKKVATTFDYYQGARSIMIAQTEVNNIANALADRRYQLAAEAGYVEEKMWLNAGDDKVRPAHIEANLQRVPIDGYFLVGGEKLKHPGDQNASAENRIGCRCAEAPVVKKS